ncbi:MAG: GDSL-type esterase/lipase family protein, partial [Planctomycetota bacterium]|nr:GDSL-type esterase/lipase family protein [Planctomycetota bacterium]
MNRSYVAILFFAFLMFATSMPITCLAQKTKPTVEPNVLPQDDFKKYGIYGNTAPRPRKVPVVETRLPLELQPGNRIALIGNTLLDRSQHFGFLESLLHQRYPKHQLIIRHLAWSADTPDLQPRPANFADLEQHLTHEKIDVIIAAFGFNESFQGEGGLETFRQHLSQLTSNLKGKSFNGHTAPRIVLISPIANENIRGINAADLNNKRIKQYSEAIRSVSQNQGVGFVDVFSGTQKAMEQPGTSLTFNGCHL